MLASGYFRAKMAQEKLIQTSPIPYTIVRSTQFFEFASGIANSATDGLSVRLPSALMQPIVSDDVAAVLASVAVAEPMNRMVDLAGPDAIPLDEVVRQFLKANRDPRTVITDEQSPYFGIPLKHRSLVPDGTPSRLGATHFETWLRRSTPNP